MFPDFLHPPFDRTEFGVCIRDKAEKAYFRVPIHANVEEVFRAALAKTIELFTQDRETATQAATIPQYDPADKHETFDPCVLSMADDALAEIKPLADASDLETSGSILRNNPEKVFFYFCRFRKGSRTFWGVRRANQFKANLKTQAALFSGDTLQLASSKVFRLDDFFDAILADETAYILRPKDLEYLAGMEDAMRSAAADRLREADAKLPFINLAPLAEEMETNGSIRRARLATSVAKRSDLAQTDKGLFAQACQQLNIDLAESNGILAPANGDAWPLLTVLDRRRYWIELIRGEHEIYEAASRERV